MDTRTVKDIMVPLDEYAVVSETATLLDAILALEAAQKRLPPGRQPIRAVLIADNDKNIVGKIGQLAFLRALEPKYNMLGNLETLAAAGVQPEFISSVMEHYRFFQDSLPDMLLRGQTITVRDVMRPVAENIDENAPLREAIHLFVMLQTLSILVTRRGTVVGLLRLSDLFDELSNEMKKAQSRNE